MENSHAMFKMIEAAIGRYFLKYVFLNLLQNYRNHLFCTLFLVKFQASKPVTLSIETPTQVVSCEYCEMFKNSFFIEHLRWLLLKS